MMLVVYSSVWSVIDAHRGPYTISTRIKHIKQSTVNQPKQTTSTTHKMQHTVNLTQLCLSRAIQRNAYTISPCIMIKYRWALRYATHVKWMQQLCQHAAVRINLSNVLRTRSVGKEQDINRAARSIPNKGEGRGRAGQHRGA